MEFSSSLLTVNLLAGGGVVCGWSPKIGLVEAINQVVPTEMAIDPGTIVLGMILDTLNLLYLSA